MRPVDPIDALRAALASRGEALVPADLAAVEITERRLARELPPALRRVYLELADGTAGTGGAQALRARTLIALTEEDVDGGQWCLLADGRVAYFLPLAGEPGLHLPLPDVAAFLGVLAATRGGEAVVAMGGVDALGLSPR